MKTSDSTIGGSLEPAAYAPFAQYFVRFIQEYAARGVPIHYITPQNEPLYQPAGYPGLLMTPEQQQLWIRDHLVTALAGPGLAPAYCRTTTTGICRCIRKRGIATTAGCSTTGTAWHCYSGGFGADRSYNAYPNEKPITPMLGGEWQGTQREAFDG